MELERAPPGWAWMGCVKTNIKALYQTEGYRVESINTDGERAQVELRWDERCKPRCTPCGVAMRINRKTRQGALDLPLASAGFVLLVYEAVQGYCRACARYETVRPLAIVEQHQATLRLMRQVSLLCRWLPVTRVCELLPIVPSTAYRWDRYILQSELPEPCLDGLEAILVDEKAIHKGQRGYVTVVLNARTGELLHLAEGRRKESLESFFAKLSAEQKQSIVAVGMDRSGPYRAVVEEQLPQADIVFDKFHIVANYHEVIDRIRRRSCREANGEGRAFIKGQRFNLFRRPEKLSDAGQAALAQLLAANADLHVAYLLKESLPQLWLYRYPKSAAKALEGWVEIALNAGIAELSRFARGLREAKIVSYCRHRLTSAKIESFNAQISRVIHKACGVSNLDYLWLKLRQASLQA
jgi:transposase